MQNIQKKRHRANMLLKYITKRMNKETWINFLRRSDCVGFTGNIKREPINDRDDFIRNHFLWRCNAKNDVANLFMIELKKDDSERIIDDADLTMEVLTRNHWKEWLEYAEETFGDALPTLLAINGKKSKPKSKNAEPKSVKSMGKQAQIYQFLANGVTIDELTDKNNEKYDFVRDEVWRRLKHYKDTAKEMKGKDKRENKNE